MWLRGATVARLTPDQKAACSNHVGVIKLFCFPTPSKLLKGGGPTKNIYLACLRLQKSFASNEDWTHDLWFTRPTLCHWAIEAYNRCLWRQVFRTADFTFYLLFDFWCYFFMCVLTTYLRYKIYSQILHEISSRVNCNDFNSGGLCSFLGLGHWIIGHENKSNLLSFPQNKLLTDFTSIFNSIFMKISLKIWDKSHIRVISVENITL